MKRSLTTLIALALGVSFGLAACGDDEKGTVDSGASDVKVTIGAQNFGESAVLAEIYKQGLAAKGFTTSIRELGGFRPVELEAFDQKTINFAPEYAASLLEGLNNKKGEASGDVGATVAKLETYLTEKGLTALKASDAVDTNAFVVTKETAKQYNLKTLSDLAARGGALKLGAPADCETNPFCLPGLQATYGLDLRPTYQALEPQQVADALDAKSIDVALLFSTAGTIASKGYVLLADDKKMLAADNVVPVVSAELGQNAEFVDAVNEITETLTTAKLITMNKRFDIDKDDAAVIAKEYLAAEFLD